MKKYRPVAFKRLEDDVIIIYFFNDDTRHIGSITLEGSNANNFLYMFPRLVPVESKWDVMDHVSVPF